jgi:hypothetical protein
VRILVPKDEPDERPARAGVGGRSAPTRKPGHRRGPPDEGEVGPSELAAEFAELQWDLGGLVYEMAARDHFRLDVVVRRAAKLQEVDAQLAETERLLRLDEASAAGECPACGALYARGAAYCWQCGKDLMAKGPVTVEPATSPTESIAAKVAEGTKGE